MNKLSRLTKNVAASADRILCRFGGRPLRTRTEGGQSLVEFVLVLPVLLVLVFGIIEFANAWRTSQIVTNAAREGARQGVLPSHPPIQTVVDNYLSQSGLDPSQATVTVDCDPDDGTTGNWTSGECTSSGDAERVRVEYQFSFSFLGPMINFMQGSGGGAYGAVTLEASTIMRNE